MVGLIGGALAAAVLGGAGPPAAVAGPSSVPLEPSSLARGSDPAVPFLVRDTIHDGALRVPAPHRGHHMALWIVAGGYVLDDRVGANVFRLVYVDHSGTARVDARRSWPLGTAVSPDGRRIGWSHALRPGPAPPSVVKVADPRTGRVLAVRRFHWASVLAVSEHRVLLNLMDARGRGTTWWWDYRHDALSRVFAQPGIRADLVHRRLVLGVGSPDSFCRRMAPLDHPRRTLWRSCPNSPRAWSPDGRHTLSTYNYFDDYGTPRWDVRTDRTGALVLRVTGRLDWHAVWESDRRFLVVAQGDDGKAAIVRCTVTGTCERASRLWALPVPDYLPNYIAPPVVLPAN